MKKYFFLVVTIAFTTNVLAQVGFNNAYPDPSSILDLTANDKGFLTPRMTKSKRELISNPAIGLLVYELPAGSPLIDNNGNIGGFFYYTSSGWVKLNHQWTRVGTTNDVSLIGNATITGIFNVGSISSGNISSTGAVSSIGTISAGNISTIGAVSSGSIANSGSISTASIAATGSIESLGGIRTQNSGPFLKTKVVPIGDWNMQLQDTKSVSTGILADKVRSAYVVIKPDIDSFFPPSTARVPLNVIDFINPDISGGIGLISDNSIDLFRTANLNNLFKATDGFNAISFNRGWLTIVYEE
jgi:hypothetical protein